MSAVWSGVLVYLFLASTVYGLLTAVFPTLVASGQWIIGGVILVSVYGVVHARSIAIKRISVTLPNTPEAWKNKRIVWISDVHLGQLHGIALAKRVVAAINALSPDIIFVGGDLYDGSGARDIPELTLPLRDLRAPQGVYFVTGNHEEYGHKDEFVLQIFCHALRSIPESRRYCSSTSRAISRWRRRRVFRCRSRDTRTRRRCGRWYISRSVPIRDSRTDSNAWDECRSIRRVASAVGGRRCASGPIVKSL